MKHRTAPPRDLGEAPGDRGGSADGSCDYFCNVTRPLQDEIVARTEYLGF